MNNCDNLMIKILDARISNVKMGLNACNDSMPCDKCPYVDQIDCKRDLTRDALEVIDALMAEINKRTSKTVEAKPGFITLTTGIVAHSENSAIWYDQSKIAVQVKDILTISDYDKCEGSMIQLKDGQQTTILVQETLEEILGKIADMKGEGE